jgi:hypothetical protein
MSPHTQDGPSEGNIAGGTETLRIGHCAVRNVQLWSASMTTEREEEGTMSRRLGIDPLVFTTRFAGAHP